MIVVVDYRLGNLGSLLNMLKKIGAEAVVSSDPEAINSAKKLILPGVGSFDKGIENIENLDLIKLLGKRVLEEKTPILGVCLGMQLLTKYSEEGSKEGLGWIDAQAIRFRFNEGQSNLKIPHMGWNVTRIKKESTLFDGLTDQEQRFYFVHSYHVVCEDETDILTETYYGYNFVSSILKDNIVGVQFHPEKSHKFGMQFLRSFVERF